MAMIGIQELNRAALDDADMIKAFALDPEFLRDVMPASSFSRESFEAVPMSVHGDAVNMPGVRLIRL